MKTMILMLALATAGLAEVAAKVPFPFEVRGEKFEAGRYTVTPVYQTMRTSWVVRNMETQRAVMVLRQAEGKPMGSGNGAMRFRCTAEGRCALVEFWNPGEVRNVLATPEWVTETAANRMVALGR